MAKKDKKIKELTGNEYSTLFDFDSPKEEAQHDATMLMFRFLSEIERLEGSERGLKKRLADAINKSQSFITQLFNGDKIINLLTLAKFQKALGIKFKIVAYKENEFDFFCMFNDPVQNFFNLLPKEDYEKHFATVTSDSTTQYSTQVIEKSSPKYS